MSKGQNELAYNRKQFNLLPNKLITFSVKRQRGKRGDLEGYSDK